MYVIKYHEFIRNSHKLRNKIVDKDFRKEHLIKVCCGDYRKCNLCRRKGSEKV